MSLVTTALVVTSVGFCVSLATVFLRRLWAVPLGWVDKPGDARRVHEHSTPTAGGVGIVAGVIAGLCVLAFSIPANEWIDVDVGVVVGGGLLIALAGWWDDTNGLGFKRKLLLQIIVAYALLHAGFRLDVAGLPFVGETAYQQALYGIPLTRRWVVGVINAVNLIDGIDGLAGGVAAIASVVMGILFLLSGSATLAIVSFLVAAAALGFLWHNFHPASIFMGDTGSLTLGYILAVLPLTGSFHVDPVLSLVIPAVILGVPILDTTLTIIRRSARKKAICGPDAQHIHHRLLKRGTMRSASLTLYGVAGWFGTASILIYALPPSWGYSILLGTMLMAVAWVRTLGYLKVKPHVRARRIRSLRQARENVGISASKVELPAENSGDGSVVDTEQYSMESVWRQQ